LFQQLARLHRQSEHAKRITHRFGSETREERRRGGDEEECREKTRGRTKRALGDDPKRAEEEEAKERVLEYTMNSMVRGRGKKTAIEERKTTAENGGVGETTGLNLSASLPPIACPQTSRHGTCQRKGKQRGEGDIPAGRNSRGGTGGFLTNGGSKAARKR